MIDTPDRPPMILVGLVVVFLALGIFISPERLIELGPGRVSLTSPQENPLAAPTARLEVAAFRGFCFVAAAVLLGVIIWWRRLTASAWFQAITNHPGSYHAGSDQSAVFNASFYVTLTAWLLGIFYFRFGGDFLPESVTIPLGAREGYLEHATAAFFLISSIIFARLAWSFRGYRPTRFFFGLVALVFFVFAGEETSWGQWIFGFETLELMHAINVQDENNLHNVFGYVAVHAFIAGVLVYGVILPLLRAYHPFWDRVFAMIGLPIPSLGLALGILPIAMSHNWTVGAVVESTTVLAIAELRELLTAIAFLVLAWECWTWGRSTRWWGIWSKTGADNRKASPWARPSVIRPGGNRRPNSSRQRRSRPGPGPSSFLQFTVCRRKVKAVFDSPFHRYANTSITIYSVLGIA